VMSRERKSLHAMPVASHRAHAHTGLGTTLNNLAVSINPNTGMLYGDALQLANVKRLCGRCFERAKANYRRQQLYHLNALAARRKFEAAAAAAGTPMEESEKKAALVEFERRQKAVADTLRSARKQHAKTANCFSVEVDGKVMTY
jgi:hypothetical protein